MLVISEGKHRQKHLVQKFKSNHLKDALLIHASMKPKTSTALFAATRVRLTLYYISGKSFSTGGSQICFDCSVFIFVE